MKFRNLVVSLAVLLGISFIASSQGPIPKADEQANLLSVSFLDIGQGDAILLTTPHRKRILIDGGPSNVILTRLGEEMAFNERTIDLAIVSHNHSDHIEGLNEVIPRYEVKSAWVSGAIHTTNEYLEMLSNLKKYNVATEVVWQGKSTTIDGVTLDVLHPLEKSEGLRPEDQHDATVVVRATYGQRTFLFTGDIDESHEQLMIKAGVPLHSDVLKVAHHGSKSGLALNFLTAVAPTYAVIQSGATNSFGHPAESILQKITDYGVAIYRNDQQGTIRMKTDGVGLNVTTQK